MSDVVWSVNIFIGIGVIATALVIYKILLISHQELQETNVSIQDKENSENH